MAERGGSADAAAIGLDEVGIGGVGGEGCVDLLVVEIVCPFIAERGDDSGRGGLGGLVSCEDCAAAGIVNPSVRNAASHCSWTYPRSAAGSVARVDWVAGQAAATIV